jgi:hypothetical protein
MSAAAKLREDFSAAVLRALARGSHFHEDHPNAKVDLNLDAMTSEDRGQAAEFLHRALEIVSSEDEPAQLKQVTKAEFARQS